MKTINQWFLFNPLFILYTDAEWYLSVLKDPQRKENYFYDPIHNVNLDPFDPDVRQMRQRENYETEHQIISHESGYRLRKRFSENETFTDLLSNLEYKSEKTPIALMTFVLSVFLSTDESLRQKFYTLYQGKIPAITQFCFNTFRISPISDESWIKAFNFLEDYHVTLYCCGVGVTFADVSFLKLYPQYIVAWFELLNRHFNNDEKNYLELVDFKRVGYISKDKNYLCGLTVTDERVTCSEKSYFHELSDDQKETYIMLARVLDSVCVPENTVLPDPQKAILKRNFDEKKITPQLIEFIVSGCKTFL